MNLRLYLSLIALCCFPLSAEPGPTWEPYNNWTKDAPFYGAENSLQEHITKNNKAKINSSYEAYSIKWQRSFNPDYEISITKAESKDQYLFNIKKIARGSHILQENQFKILIEIALQKDDIRKFRNELNTIDFWKMKPKGGVSGLDGDTLLVEAVVKGKYHAIYRWSDENLNGIRKWILNISKQQKILNHLEASK